MTLFADSVGSGSVTTSAFSLRGIDESDTSTLSMTEGGTSSSRGWDEKDQEYARTSGASETAQHNDEPSDTCSVTSTGECRERVRLHDDTRGSLPSKKSKPMFTPLRSKTGSEGSSSSHTKTSKSRNANEKESRTRSGAPTAPVPGPPSVEDGAENNETSSTLENASQEDEEDFKNSDDMQTCATNDSVRISVNDGFWRVCKLVLVIIVGVSGLLYVMHQRTRAYIATLMQELSDRNTISMSEFDLNPLKSLCGKVSQTTSSAGAPLAAAQTAIE